MIEGRILKCETFLDELLENRKIFKHFVKLIIPYQISVVADNLVKKQMAFSTIQSDIRDLCE